MRNVTRLAFATGVHLTMANAAKRGYTKTWIQLPRDM
jgi:hypothetical protein